MGTPLIEIKNLSAGYDSRTVLRNINLTVYDRDFLGIIGPNGGGKTTLIKCILGLLKPTGGEILYRGGRALKMGYLPQYNSIDRKFPITVEEVILSGLSSQKSLISRFTAAHREKARQVIARMGLEGLEERAIETFGRVKNNGKTVSSNVDFYSGFVYEMIGLPQEIFTPLFAMARIVGWCAHRNEELNFEGKRIIRPAYKNVLEDTTYVPIKKR